ncbi:MAG TPA: ATP-binding protein, partial [Prosthecobacter sp.]
PGTWWLAPGGPVPLFPLHYLDGADGVKTGNHVSNGNVLPQLYCRFMEQRQTAAYTVTSGGISWSEHGNPVASSLAEFLGFFKPAEKATAHGAADAVHEAWQRNRYDFDDVADLAPKELVGRKPALEAATAWAREQAAAGGVLWVGGDPGMGKSAFMARLARQLTSRTVTHAGETPPPATRFTGLKVLSYFFRNGDARCHPDRFFEAATLRLELILQQKLPHQRNARPKERFAAAMETWMQSKRDAEPLVFLLDGMDELVRQHPTEWNIPSSFQCAGCLWVCAGRNEASLVELRNFAGRQLWLEKLSEADVREYLDRELRPDVRRDFHIKEGASATGVDSQDAGLSAREARARANPLVRVVAERSKGLPIYLELLVDQLNQGERHLGGLDRLPDGLNAYYEELLEAEQVNDIKHVLIDLVCVLAWARQPLTKGVLTELLKEFPEYQVEPVIDAALKAGSALIVPRRTRAGEQTWSLYHESFREFLRQSNKVVARRSAMQHRILEWCRKWPQHRHRYALLYFAEHLLEAGRHDELYELARNQDFAGALNHEFHSAPFAPLETVRTALRAAIDRRQCVRMVEFALSHATQALAIQQESPLEALRGGNYRRALQLIQKLERPADRLIWRLVLAAESVASNDWHEAVRILREIPFSDYGLIRNEAHSTCAVSLLAPLARIRGAEHVWEQIVFKLHPESKGLLARLLADMGNIDLAMQVVEKMPDMADGRANRQEQNGKDNVRQEIVKLLCNRGEIEAGLNLAEEIATPRIQAWAWTYVGKTQAEAGNWDEALSFTRRLWDAGFPEQCAVLHMQLATLCSDTWHRLDHLGKALAIVNQTQWTYHGTKAKLCAQRALAQVQCGFAKPAVESFGRALQSVRHMPKKTSRKVLESKAGAYRHILYQLTQAAEAEPSLTQLCEEVLAEAALFVKTHLEKSEEGAEHMKLHAMLLARRGDFEGAFDLARTIRPVLVRSTAYGMIAAEMEKARGPVFGLVEKVRRAEGRRSPQLLTFIGRLAREWVKIGNEREAHLLVAEQLEQFAPTDSAHVWGVPRALGNLAAAFHERGAREASLEVLNEAASMVDDFNGPQLLYSRCNLATSMGLSGEHAKAEHFFQLALRDARSRPDKLCEVAGFMHDAGFQDKALETIQQAVRDIDAAAPGKEPWIALKGYGEAIEALAETGNEPETHAVVGKATDFLRRIGNHKDRMVGTGKLAVQVLKAAIQGMVPMDRVRELLAFIDEICEQSRTSATPLDPSNEATRIRAVLQASEGQWESAARTALKNIKHDQNEREKAVRDIALLAIRQDLPLKASEMVHRYFDGASQRLGDVAKAIAFRAGSQPGGGSNEACQTAYGQLLLQGAWHLKSTYLLVATLFKIYPVSVEELAEIRDLL